ncbi:iron uptake system protein EfeO [Nocardioides aquiterrae]|uniref:Peptidase M75 family protein n=1 Tax=Nocardioides aquiterrae TaxID=203799 RepID=A0ABP4F9M1_9ACTN
MRKTLLVALLFATPLFAACTENVRSGSDSGDARTIAVTSTDDGCEVSSSEAPSGSLTFDVTNDGSTVTEFYLFGEDGKRIVGEVENIGPGLSRQLVVAASAGTYVTACKPGMKGDGIRADFTVTKSDQEPTVSAGTDEQVDRALTRYEEYVREQSGQLVAKTKQFVALYERGDDAAARALYPAARTHWERIETVAESFGDLDPKTDAREADLEPGQKWTGWHRIEKDLWPPASGYRPLTTEQRAFYADDLLRNTETLDGRIQQLTYTVDQIANGSRGLMEEVAKGKVTGEEEIWSHTDLWDFQANVDGAHEGFEYLEPILAQKDPELLETLDDRFAALQKLLDAQRTDDGFVPYDQLSRDEVKQLANAVNALAEPLSELTAAVLS